jgi:hypothetical protein
MGDVVVSEFATLDGVFGLVDCRPAAQTAILVSRRARV